MKLLRILLDWLFGMTDTNNKSAPQDPLEITPPTPTRASNYLWIIDNGHASSTPGKRSPFFSDGTQLLEYHFNREVAQKLCADLHAEGIDYHLLVPEDHQDISLGERCRRANNLPSTKKKILVSIHGNAAGDGVSWSPAHGLETFHHAGSTSGHKIAVIFQQHIKGETSLKSRGIKTANFYILKYTSMPAILTENGFFTNKKECEYMRSEAGTTNIARGHLKAIKEVEQLKLI